MILTRLAAPGRSGTRRAGLGRRTSHLLGLALVVTAVVVTGCAGHSSPHTGNSDSTGSAADTVKNLGAVPIPTAPSAQATPTADENHLQLVTMGDTVDAHLPGVQALVRASGPTEDLPATSGSKPLRHTTGTITVTFDRATAALTVRAADLTSRDETGKNIALTATPAGSVTATPGHPATVTLRGTFDAGAAELTWRHDGKVIAIWDFNIELD